MLWLVPSLAVAAGPPLASPASGAAPESPLDGVVLSLGFGVEVPDVVGAGEVPVLALVGGVVAALDVLLAGSEAGYRGVALLLQADELGDEPAAPG